MAQERREWEGRAAEGHVAERENKKTEYYPLRKIVINELNFLHETAITFN